VDVDARGSVVCSSTGASSEKPACTYVRFRPKFVIRVMVRFSGRRGLIRDA